MEIITFGSAVWDVFLRTKEFLFADVDRYPGKELCLPWGKKVKVDEISFHSGGGGTNVASNLAAQGFKVAYCGRIGRDIEGDKILKELKNRGVSTSLVVKKGKTDLSFILSTPKERTILTYKRNFLIKKDIPWDKIKKSKWFYLAPLPEMDFLTRFAKKNNIQVMANPDKLNRPLLKKIDILLLNKQEAQALARSSDSSKELIKTIKKFYSGILAITDGSNRVFVADSQFIYSALPSKIKIKDKTGAGDAFGSGFLGGFIKTKNIQSALCSGINSSLSCLQCWGAKQGIALKKEIKVKKERL